MSGGGRKERLQEEKEGGAREVELEVEEASPERLVFLWLEAEFDGDGERNRPPRGGE
jgi:hypothetical protein